MLAQICTDILVQTAIFTFIVNNKYQLWEQLMTSLTHCFQFDTICHQVHMFSDVNLSVCMPSYYTIIYIYICVLYVHIVPSEQQGRQDSNTLMIL